MQLPDFCIFAVKINSESSTGKKILEQGVVYPLLKGYKVNGKSIIYNEKRHRTHLYIPTMLVNIVY